MLGGGSSHCLTTARLQTHRFLKLQQLRKSHLGTKGDEVSRKGMALLCLSTTAHLDQTYGLRSCFALPLQCKWVRDS